ncbi:MAG: hypothetical protein QW478_11475 [Candidatus Micrarchaeaceae archaeon]
MQKSFSFNGWHIDASSEVTEEGVLYMFEDTMLRNEQESPSIPRISEGKERLSSLVEKRSEFGKIPAPPNLDLIRRRYTGCERQRRR